MTEQVAFLDQAGRSEVVPSPSNGLPVRSVGGPNDWSYAAATSGIANTTTAVTIKAAASAGLRNYITGITLQTATLGGATEFAIRDGAGGTVLWRTQLQTTAMPLVQVQFQTPLRGSAATLLEIVTLTGVTGGVYFNAQGYVAP